MMKSLYSAADVINEFLTPKNPICETRTTVYSVLVMEILDIPIFLSFGCFGVGQNYFHIQGHHEKTERDISVWIFTFLNTMIEDTFCQRK